MSIPLQRAACNAKNSPAAHRWVGKRARNLLNLKIVCWTSVVLLLFLEFPPPQTALQPLGRVFVVLRSFAVVLRGIFRHGQISLRSVVASGFPGNLGSRLTKDCDVPIDGL